MKSANDILYALLENEVEYTEKVIIEAMYQYAKQVIDKAIIINDTRSTDSAKRKALESIKLS